MGLRHFFKMPRAYQQIVPWTIACISLCVTCYFIGKQEQYNGSLAYANHDRQKKEETRDTREYPIHDTTQRFDAASRKPSSDYDVTKKEYIPPEPQPDIHVAASNDKETDGKYGKPVMDSNHLVVYNKVGKAGSRTMMALMESIRKRNGFKSIVGTESLRKSKSLDYLPKYHRIIEESVDQIELPALLHGHFPFFKVDDSRHPVYINMIRDPLSQRISDYYFARFGDATSYHQRRVSNLTIGSDIREFLNETFDECVLSARDECTSDYRNSYQVAFFCGIDPRCRELTEWTLEMAKKNVMDNFLLVGILEEYEASLHMLEKLAPALFGGLADRYEGPNKSNLTEKTRTVQKIPPSAEVEAIMRAKLEIPYKFYNFVKSKFYKVMEELDVKPNTAK